MKRTFVIFLALIFFELTLSAQISEGGEPFSFSKQYFKAGLKFPDVPVYALPYINNDSASQRAEQIKNEECATCKKEYYGVGIDVDIDIMKLATHQTMPDGSSLWFYKFKSTTAYSLQFYFDQFYIPEGGRLFFYNADKSMILGAFTSKNNSDSKKFPTQPISGNEVTIEYYEPSNVDFKSQLHIFKVIHDFRGLFAKSGPFGNSGSCNINVNCPQGYGWEKEARSVALILMYDNTINLVARCSGALLNNQLQNQYPYFLSANHCLGSASNGGDPTYWVFLFNHQTSSCNGNGMSAPYTMSIASASIIWNSSASDCAWLQLSSIPPPSFNVCYAGWDRTGTIPAEGTCIHHPAGDVKKISLDFDNLTQATQSIGSNPAADCWKVTAWNLGTTEGGSSGSPLFNSSHRVIGQLFGGSASCSNLNGSDYFGRFVTSWINGSLNYELDPNNTGITTIDTYCPINYCGTTTLTNSSGSFSDGSGGSNYANMSNCKWLIQPSAVGINSITVTFNSFATETGYDSVIIYDGSDYWAPILGSYSGTLSPFSVTSTGCEMFIRFVSDTSITASGFTATYSTNIPCSGTTTLTGTSGSFSDGSGTNNYGCSADCKWLIQPPCASSVTLNFTSFDTESGYDFVKVYNGPTTASPLLGTFSGTNLPPTLAATSGSMLVHFVSDGDEQRSGWTASYSSNSTPPNPSISPANVTICSGSSTILTASGGGSYTWSNSLGNNPQVVVTPATTTTYTVTVTNNGCSATASKIVTVNPKPNPPTFAPASGCSPLTVTASSTNCTGCTYQWSTGANGATASFPNSFTYTVTATNSFNCTASASGSATITGQPSVAISPANPAFCAGSSATISVSPSGTGYVWSGPAGFSSNASSVNVTQGGIYSVTVTNPGSCSGTAAASVNVTQYSAPVANAGNDTTIAQGGSAVLTATGGINYQWSNGGTAQITSVFPSQTTIYTVTVTNVNGCTATDNVTVFVQSSGCNGVYQLSASSTLVPATGGTATVNLTTGANCTWSVNAGACSSFTTVNTPNGSGAATVSFTVQPNPLPSQRTCFVTIAGQLFQIIQQAAPTGLNETSLIQNISLYPNPNRGQFTLNVESAQQQNLTASIFNALGQLVHTQQVQTNTPTNINLTNTTNGIYYLQVQLGQTNHYLKFAIE